MYAIVRGGIKESNTGKIFFQLIAQQCYIASCDCLLPVLPSARATNFHVELQHTGISRLPFLW